MKITIKDVIKELRREVEEREKNYPLLIQRGKLHKAIAKKRYLALKFALELIEAKAAKKTGIQQKLF